MELMLQANINEIGLKHQNYLKRYKHYVGISKCFKELSGTFPELFSYKSSSGTNKE